MYSQSESYTSSYGTSAIGRGSAGPLAVSRVVTSTNNFELEDKGAIGSYDRPGSQALNYLSSIATGVVVPKARVSETITNFSRHEPVKATREFISGSALESTYIPHNTKFEYGYSASSKAVGGPTFYSASKDIAADLGRYNSDDRRSYGSYGGVDYSSAQEYGSLGNASRNFGIGTSDFEKKSGSKLGFYKEMIEKIKREDSESKKAQLDKELEQKREKQRLYDEKQKVDYLALLKNNIGERRSRSSQFIQPTAEYSSSYSTASATMTPILSVTKRFY